MSKPTPELTLRKTVINDWVDYNGHMNVAFYVLVFDLATDELLAMIGVDEKSREATGSSVFAAEAHVTYDQEVMEGEEVYITTQVLDHDAKRLHLFHHMYRSEDDTLCATNEVMILHVNLNDRRVGPWPGTVVEKLQDMAEQHIKLPRPAAAGRVIGIRRKST